MNIRALLLSAFALCALCWPMPASAHPHVWVDVQTKLLFDDKGRLSGLHHRWSFDEAYSAFAVTGLDTDKDGKLSPKELQPLAKVNMESLGEFGFFTFVMIGEQKAELTEPVDYSIEYTGGRAILTFALPLQKPVDGRKQDVSFAVYDPTFYVDFAYAKKQPVSVADNAPGLCRAHYQAPKEPDPAEVKKLSEMTEEDFANIDPNEMSGQYDARVRLLCGRMKPTN